MSLRKVNEASGVVLDWMVAYANLSGKPWEKVHFGPMCVRSHKLYLNSGVTMPYEPSANWAQGGPIIERELLAPEPLLDTNCALIQWRCRNWKGDGADFYGPTPLIAAMRAFVVSKLGEEIEIPEELCESK